MMYFLAVVLVVAAPVQGRTFNNPVIGGGIHNEPGAIKIDGTYYVITANEDFGNGQLEIYTSTNLINYKLSGYVFNINNVPAWAVGAELSCAEIHKIGTNYHVYFMTYKNGWYNIGVAVSSQPLGPYTATDRPMFPTSTNVYDPSIIKFEDKLYLTWVEDRSIRARQLNSDGLSFATEPTSVILTPSLSWEGGLTHGPWYVRRGSYHYLFFSSGGYCYEDYNVGVARSTNLLGPYEKIKNPIVVSNVNFVSTGHVSVVKDLDDQNDVIFFSAYRKGGSCSYETLLASLQWDINGWPYVGDF